MVLTHYDPLKIIVYHNKKKLAFVPIVCYTINVSFSFGSAKLSFALLSVRSMSPGFFLLHLKIDAQYYTVSRRRHAFASTTIIPALGQ